MERHDRQTPRGARRLRPQLGILERRLVLSGTNLLSYHNDPYLSGANLNETTLTQSNVNPTDFGQLFTQAVDGYVYAEPLYMSNLTIDGAQHNVVFVATQNDTVYAFDADSNLGADAAPLWSHSFTDPANGITAVPQPDVITHDIVPVIGITGTPVIDPTTGTLYVVTKTKQVINGDTAHPNYIQTLHALDVTTGQDQFAGGGYLIGDTVDYPDGSHINNTAIQVAGTGDDSVNGVVTFNALRENQRPALQLDGNLVLVGWASHGDNQPYHGWLAAFDKTTLQPVAWFNVDPNGTEAGIWQSGDPPAYDPATGAIYFATGNGTFDELGSSPDNDYGESVIRLSPTPVGNQFVVQDFFTPYEFQTLNDNDADLGSGGTMLLPDSVGSAAHPHLMVETGKSGKIYLIDRDDMGEIQNPGTGPDGDVQTVTAGQAGVWGSPAFLQVNSTTGIIYYHGSGDVLKGYYVTNGHIEDGSLPGDQPILLGNYVAGYPGAQPVISANGTVDLNSPTDPIVWELQVDQYGTSGVSVLRAYDATNPADELYDSSMTGNRDLPAGAVKFTVPTVADGHVFVGSQYELAVYGEFPQSTAAPATPTNLTAQTTLGQGSQIQLNWSNPAPAQGAAATGIEIYRSTDGVNFNLLTTVPASATVYTDPGPFVPGQEYLYELVATNQTGSSTATAAVPVQVFIASPVMTLTNVDASSISLSWTGVANDHYDIERSSDGVTFSVVGTVPASQTGFTDVGLAAGVYAYRIRAFNANPTASSVSNVEGATVGSVIDQSGGFVNTSGLTANGSAQFAENTARLTNANDQTGSVFTNNRLAIGSFNTSFTIRLHEGTQPDYADGLTFVIQADSPTQLGLGTGGMGYQDIAQSIAIKFDPFQNPGDPSDSSTGLFSNGAGPFGGVDTTGNGGPLLNSQATKLVSLAYDRSKLTETITNTLDASEVFTTSYQINIPATIGSDTAYVGFTAATGDSNFWELQDVTGWTFSSTAPSPGAPTDLRESASTGSEIDLTWTSNSYNEDGFTVERSTDGVNFTAIGTTTTETFQDTGLAAGNYYYRVKAYNAAGPSPYSNTLLAATGTVIDYSGGFSSHTSLVANGTVDWNDGVAQLTNGYGGEAASLWYQTPVSISAFSTTFTFQMLPGTSPPPIADGFTFTIQNDPSGTAALGSAGGGLGFGSDSGGPIINNSVAVKFDAYKPGGGNTSTGLYFEGDLPAAGSPSPDDVYVPLDGTGIDFNGAATAPVPHLFQVELSYDGATLTETIEDLTTSATFTTSYQVNIAAYVGSGTALVGFTAGTGGATSLQDIDTWSGSFLNNPPAFPHVSAPWSDTDIGGPALTGSASEQNGAVTVFASGNDIWNNADEFHFVYRPMLGDATIIAQVVSQQFSDPWSKAGVMMRESLDPGSPDVGAYVTPGNGATLQWRPTEDAAATWYGNTVAAAAPYWVMLVRSGSTFTASASPDGQNWTDLGSITIPMTNQIYVGLALSAHDDGVMNRSTFGNVSLTSPAPSQLVVTQPASTTAGSPFALNVMAEDQFGNIATQFNASVGVALKTNTGNSLAGTLSMNATSGVADFSDLVLDTAAKGYTIAVTSAALPSVTTGSFDVIAAQATALIVTQAPATSVIAGSPFEVALVADDPYGNLANQFTGSVSVALSTNSGSTLLGALNLNASSGAADFSSLILDTAATGYTIQATAAGLSSATTGSFDVVPAAASKLVAISEPAGSVTAGSTFEVKVVARDMYGNTVTTFNDNVGVALQTNGGNNLAGTVSMNAIAGVADFSNLVLDTAALGYSIAVTSAALPTLTTGSFDVIPAQPSTLIVTKAPTNPIIAGSPFDVAIAVDDPYGNLATQFSGSVNVALKTDMGSKLLGAANMNVSAGIADFPSLSLDTAATDYAIEATNVLVKSATTGTFDVVPAAASKLAVTSEPSGSVTAGTAFDVTVVAEDRFGNIATQYRGAVGVSSMSNAGSRLVGTVSMDPVAGVADFSQSGSGLGRQRLYRSPRPAPGSPKQHDPATFAVVAAACKEPGLHRASADPST